MSKKSKLLRDPNDRVPKALYLYTKRMNECRGILLREALRRLREAGTPFTDAERKAAIDKELLRREVAHKNAVRRFGILAVNGTVSKKAGIRVKITRRRLSL